MGSNMSVDVLKNGMDNLAKSYLWELLIPRLPGGGDITALETRCQSIQLPGRSLSKIHIDYKQSPGFNVAGKLRYPQTWTLTFVEAADSKVFKAIYNWKQLGVNDFTNIGMGDAAFKADLVLNLMSVANVDYNRIKVVGCFPQEIANVDLNYEGEGAIIFNVTFSYDRWIPVL
jgi:hypothetical protein